MFILAFLFGLLGGPCGRGSPSGFGPAAKTDTKLGAILLERTGGGGRAGLMVPLGPLAATCWPTLCIKSNECTLGGGGGGGREVGGAGFGGGS